MKALRLSLAVLTLAAALPAGAQSPDAVWQKYTPGAAYYAVTSDTKRVYAVGRADNPGGGGHDVLIDAFNPETGAAMWHKQLSGALWNDDESAGMWSAEIYTAPNQLRNDLVEVSGNRLYVGGASCHPANGCDVDRPNDDPNHASTSTLMAFDAGTGNLVWAKNAGLGNGMLAMTTGGGRIFTADALFVDAWDSNGTLLWTHFVEGTPSALRYDGGKLFLAYDGSFDAAPYAVAYDPSNGNVLWKQPRAIGDQVSALASGAGRLVAAGRHDAPDGTPYVRIESLSQTTGALQWTAPSGNRNEVRGEAIAVAVNGSRVFAAGIRRPAAATTGFFVRAHELSSGATLWNDEPDLGQYAAAYAVSYLTGLNRPDDVPSRIGSSLVVAAGFGTDDVGDGYGVLRAYDPKTGQLVWQHTFATVDRRDEFVSLAKAGRHVVTVGTATPNLSFKWGKTPQAGYPDMAEAIVGTFE